MGLGRCVSQYGAQSLPEEDLTLSEWYPAKRQRERPGRRHWQSVPPCNLISTVFGTSSLVWVRGLSVFSALVEIVFSCLGRFGRNIYCVVMPANASQQDCKAKNDIGGCLFRIPPQPRRPEGRKEGSVLVAVQKEKRILTAPISARTFCWQERQHVSRKQRSCCRFMSVLFITYIAPGRSALSKAFPAKSPACEHTRRCVRTVQSNRPRHASSDLAVSVSAEYPSAVLHYIPGTCRKPGSPKRMGGWVGPFPSPGEFQVPHLKRDVG